MAADEIDLTARARSARVVRWIGHVLAPLIAAGCLASFVAGPEEPPVRLIAGAAGLLTVLLYAWVLVTRRRLPARLVVDHEGVRVRDGRGKVIVRLAWTELSGVGVMTNEAGRRRQLRDAAGDPVPWVRRRMVRVPIWLWRGHRSGSFLLPAFAVLFARLWREGVRILVGTDAGIAPVKPHPTLPYGVAHLASLGVPAADALRTCTATAAQVCGVGDRKGRIAPGYDADLMAVPGDPLADLAVLHRPVAVFARGERVR